VALRKVVLHVETSDDAPAGAAREWDSLAGALLALSCTYKDGSFQRRYLEAMATSARSRAEVAVAKPKRTRRVQ
jgi:hypothetical protein